MPGEVRREKSFPVCVCPCVCVAKQKMDLNDITYKINGAIFEVNRELGSGFLEKVYENALLAELKGMGLKAESKFPIIVEYKGKEVGEY